MPDKITVLSDMRWPAATGIGLVMDAVLARKPASIEVRSLPIKGGIGSPLSPLAISMAAGREKGDVFWSAGFVPPAYARQPSAVTVHDLTHLHYYNKTHRLYYQAVLRPLYRRTSAVICVSDYTRDEFLAWSGMDAARVHTVHNGADPAFLANERTLEMPYPFVLYPGNHRSYKNLPRLVRAYAASRLPGLGVHLAMTGRSNPEIAAIAQELGIADKVHALGFIAQDDLPALYKSAQAIAYVSLYEGFGLPILEGMASGTPVLTSNVTSMPEVAGGAALLVDPASTEAIAAGLNSIVTDDSLRLRLSSDGRKRVRAFTWDKSAARVWNIVEEVGST